MNLHRILYSRSFSVDYRWMYAPPENETTMIAVMEALWNSYEGASRELGSRNLPVVFGILGRNSGIIGRYSVTGRRDRGNRPISALEGWYATRRELPLLFASCLAVIGCHDLAFVQDSDAGDLDRIRGEIVAVNYVEADAIEAFNLRYPSFFERAPVNLEGAGKLELPYSEGGFGKLLDAIEGFYRYGARSFAFGLPRSFPERIHQFGIAAYVDGTARSADNEVGRTPPPLKIERDAKRVITEVVLVQHPERRDRSIFLLKDLTNDKLYSFEETIEFPSESNFLGFGTPSVVITPALKAFDNLMDVLDKNHWTLRRDRGEHWWSVRFQKD